jgi:signal transduction histidine kinase
LITTLRKAVFKHGYLLITAAWLYTLSFIVTNYWTYNSSPKKVKHRIEEKLALAENSFKKITDDDSLLSTLINDKPSDEKANLTKEKFGIFIYTFNDVGNPILTYWNNNHIAINSEDINKQNGNYFVEYQNGYFELIKRTIDLPSQKIIAVAAVPVVWDYFVQNKYLKKEFDGFEGLEKQYEIADDSTALPIFNSRGEELFKIKQKGSHNYASYDNFTVLLRLIVILMLMVFINSVAIEMLKKYSLNIVFSILLAFVVLLRFLSYYITFFFDYGRLPLFDPSIYASNKLHPSLGDLFINAILFFWMVSFYKYNYIKQPIKEIVFKKPWIKYINLFLLSFSALFITSLIRSLVQDSKISFDVTNFFSILNVYSIVSFVLLCFLFLGFYHLSHILLRAVIETKTDIVQQLVAVAVSGLLFLSFNIGHPATASNIFIIAWLIVYVLLMNDRKQDIYTALLKSSFFIFWIMIFAVSVAALVMYQSKVVEIEQRKKMAERLVTQVDPSGENLLSIAISNLNENVLERNFNRFESERSNKYIKDSLINENFSGYLNKYETRIYVFDSFFRPLYNDDSTSYAALHTIIHGQGKHTAVDSFLYTYQNADDKLSYLYERTIKKADSTLGYFYIVVKPKRYKSEALYPELFKQVQDLSIDLAMDYAYAVYNNGKLISRYNDYDFQLQLNKKDVPLFGSRIDNKNGYSELWYKASNGKVIMIVKKNTLFLEAATLFAYLFGIFLIVICLYHLGSFAFQTKLNWKKIKSLFTLSIRTQIHATIIFISVFSFIVIGIATISFFIVRFKKNNRDRLTKEIQVMSNEIDEKVRQFRSAVSFDDALTINDIGIGNDLERKITEVSEVHNVDVNLYNKNGTLLASTQPYIYNKQLLSDKIDATAYNALYYHKDAHFVQSENIGNLQYLSIYIPVVDEDGHINGYLNIPYLNSQVELNQEISGFLATLINLNAFIFLLAGAIAFILTNRIVASFSLIGDKMNEVALGKENEAIVWNRHDEIGVLVGEYNKMVKKLEQSAKALAQSEREGAWREMARQVAHEIKNPLTPMKLSIQYLQNAIHNNAPNTKELSERVAATLIEQIDQLSKIAGDFSQFANITNVSLEKFDISESIASSINLYQGNTNVIIDWKKENGYYTVSADKIQMNRLFTNLFKNAIEATLENEQTKINVHQSIEGGKIKIEIADNGSGIPQSMVDKIFTPNFTTKTSGTGLGLAISKGIVEKAYGTISFVTEEGLGTIFSILLPKA